MSKKFLVICSFLYFTLSSAQYKSGIVQYEIAAVEVPFKDGNSQNDMVKTLIEIAKTQNFALKFNSSVSSFIPIETIDRKLYDENLIKIASMAYATSDSYFLNINTKEFVTKAEDDILVKSDMLTSVWEISTETKLIDTYLCYKAVYNYEYMARDAKAKTKTITAWFAPSLPFAFGPIEFHGLPGLILELNKDYTTYLARKITLLAEEIKINFPKGKTITYDEYEKKVLSGN